MQKIFLRLLFALSLFGTAPFAHARSDTVVSLDMCADQYALALLPKARIAGLSMRARHMDSYYRERVQDIPLRRASLETLLALRPKAVIRTWGGDGRLIARLKREGIRVIQINEVNTFAEAGAEVVRVSDELKVGAAGRHQKALMVEALRQIPKTNNPRRILYYTPSGYSAGKSTWVGQLIAQTGNQMVADEDYFFYLSPEAFLREKADVYALGFYDDAYAMRRAPGRHPLVRSRLSVAPHVSIPSPLLACNAWYSAFGLTDLARRLS